MTMQDIHKTKKTFLNATVLKQRSPTQKTPRSVTSSSSTTNTKRSKKRQSTTVINKKIVTPIKLPPILEKSPLKPQNTQQQISTAYVQSSLRVQLSTTAIINSVSTSKRLKPTIGQLRLPPIRDHAVNENLIQKPTLKCKSPRADSAVTRSLAIFGSESRERIESAHPLQNMNVKSFLTDSACRRLRRLFKKLDTDEDGHLSYTQVQRCLPTNLSKAQITFFRVLYDVISGATFFGIQEFYATAIIVEMIVAQNSNLWNKLVDDVDFNYYHDHILELIEEFNERCTIKAEIINYEILLDIILKQIVNGKTERITKELENIMPNIQATTINRLEFIALLPVIIYLESCSGRQQELFRFRNNSLLDVHSKRLVLV